MSRGSTDETRTGVQRTPSATPLRVAVLASGRGSNLQALIDATRAGDLPAELVVVASNRPACRALERARDAGIATIALDPAAFATRAAFDHALFERVAEHAPDWIVLAGFMRVLAPEVLLPWQGRIVNIHPSLLPKYAGLDTHRRALEAGDRVHGATVHLVTAELDGGPRLAVVEIDVQAGDTPVTLAARLLAHEHRLLVATLTAIARGRIGWTDGRLLLDGVGRDAPLRLGTDGLS